MLTPRTPRQGPLGWIPSGAVRPREDVQMVSQAGALKLL